MIPGGLTDIYQLGIAACVGQKAVVDQTIVNDDIGPLQ
jgi:hypothetical protein